MAFVPVEKKRIYHVIIEQIKGAIDRGELKPGDRLPSERKLAESLSVSRSTIKEAISVLESAGIVDIRPGVGVFLRQNSLEHIILDINMILGKKTNMVELLEFRQALESNAAYYAALRATAEDHARIKKAFEKLEQAVLDNRIAALEDFAFHMEVCLASKNMLFKKVLDSISDVFLDGLKESRSISQKMGRSKIILEEHRKIYEAILSGDATLSRKEMWEHIQKVKERFIPVPSGTKDSFDLKR